MNNRYYTSIRPLTFLFLSFFFFLFSSVVFGQVGIGTTNPNGNALLEIDATTTVGGLLLPRVALTNTTSAAPLSAHVQGMTVYNTVAIGDVTPGYYYNDGSNWVRIAAEPIAEGWGCAGNVGTVPGTGVGENYIGTSDAQDLIMATSNSERLRLMGTTGDIGIGSNLPLARLHLSIDGNNRGSLFSEITINNSNWSAGEFFNPNIVGGAGIITGGFSGIVGISTEPVTGWAGLFYGDVGVTGDYYYVSDERFKKNISPLNGNESMLKKIMQLKPKSYNWRSEEYTGIGFNSNKKSYGFIAQELEVIFPDLVVSKNITNYNSNLKNKKESTENFYLVNYIGLIPIIAEAIQEQQQIIDSQEVRIAKLEVMVQELLNNR